ncbi:MAG TPA: PspC domain-containing protein [Ignavibacteriaceae bacterium]|jgi:phage shock protein C|nr:PspC domain-containing protein [Ignavibacteriaceae bacterium]
MKKRLTRSVRDKVFSGVAGGIAEYIEVDPVIVRISFVLLTLLHGVGLIVYIVCMVIMPQEILLPDEMQEKYKGMETAGNEKKKGNREKYFGALLMGIGVIFLLKNIADWRFFEIVPFILIVIGVWLVMNSIKKEEVSQ